MGNTQAAYRQRIETYLQSRPGDPPQPDPLEFSRAAALLGLGDTEYRLNYIPLGGYVKMLGQDDLRPGQLSDDPAPTTARPSANA